MNIDILFNAMVNTRCLTLIKNTPGSQRFKHRICDQLTETTIVSTITKANKTLYANGTHTRYLRLSN